ncbi:MAG: sugar phosphate isomerase/epimerase family protein [Verrucomicrobiales bacterium]
MTTRRRFLTTSVLAVPALPAILRAEETKPLFEISLAQWSLHRAHQGGKMKNLDFPAAAKKDYGISGVEFVNQFWKDQAKDQSYLKDLKQRCTDNGVTAVLIMCDDEGNLGDPDEAKRQQAVENHKKWVEAAKFLGCHSIRVNAATGDQGSPAEQGRRAADGLRKLAEIAKPHEINVIVENHGGLSSHGEWLAATIKEVGLPNAGTLPDFGNFHSYDRYKGVDETMPYAKGVSAKSHDFDPATGDETRTDYRKMLDIVLNKHGYSGWIGIEYEGGQLDEPAGIRATKALLEKIRAEMAAKKA